MSRKLWQLGFILAGLALVPQVLHGPLVDSQQLREWPQDRIARGLRAVGAPSSRVKPVAAAINRHAKAAGIDPALVIAVISVENRELVRHSQSEKGATGIMQVMPTWFPKFRRRCGGDPTAVDTNICMGVRVLKVHLADARGSLRRGLLAYNGCQTNPQCYTYPDVVLRRLQRIRVAMNTPSPRPHDAL